MNSSLIDRRRFCVSLGFGLFLTQLSRAADELQLADEPKFDSWEELAERGQRFEHWTPEQDEHWRWYRLERYIKGNWESAGISLPISKETGSPYEASDGYISPTRIPNHVVNGELPELSEEVKRQMAPSLFDPLLATNHLPDPEVRSRHGKPASEWLRSLHAKELRGWLATIQPPEATVAGMTFWVHLVRDHGFDPRRIEGLNEHEFLLLHSAAHYGY